MFIIIEKQTLVIVIFLMFFASGGFSSAPSVISEIAGYYGLKRSALLIWLERSIKPAIVVVLIASSISYMKYSSFDKAPKPLEHMRVGIYLKDTVSPEYEEINVMARKPFVNYYSGARFTMIPYAGAAEVLNFARLYHVDYIVVDERFLGKWDYYDELTNLEKYADDVTLFYEDRSAPPIKLYKVGA